MEITIMEKHRNMISFSLITKCENENDLKGKTRIPRICLKFKKKERFRKKLKDSNKKFNDTFELRI